MRALSLHGSLLLMAFFLHTVLTAPVIDDNTALLSGEQLAEGRGCYYNYENYEEGDRIITNEPCLNCTCHNRLLMCYLRVCPFTKAIGQDCKIEKRPDQCCPIITCPQVPVALLTSSTTEMTSTTTALGHPDNYGCVLEDNTFYADGAQVPSDLKKPCELCYCIRNQTACVMQECTLHVEGCTPVYQEGVCCPVRYNCDHEDIPTTPQPTVGLITTPGGPNECQVNNTIYQDGELITNMTDNPCEHCYCMRGDLVCAVQECGSPLENTECTPMPTETGMCCPRTYHCPNGTTSVADMQQKPTPASENLSATENPPKNDEAEADNVEDHHPEEITTDENEGKPSENTQILEIVTTTSPVESDEVAPHTNDVTEEEKLPEGSDEGSEKDDNESDSSLLPSSESTETSTENVVVNPSQTEMNHVSPDHGAETSSIEETTTASSNVEESDRETSETTQKLTDGTPENTEPEKQETEEESPSKPTEPTVEEKPETTQAPVSDSSATELPRIPGEGSCLHEGVTYPSNSEIVSADPCKRCKCHNSIVFCHDFECPEPPISAESNCVPMPPTDDACCPTYLCEQSPSQEPEADNHLSIDKVYQVSDEEESSEGVIQHSPLPPPNNEYTVSSVEGIPEDIVPESDEIHPSSNSHESIAPTIPSEQPSVSDVDVTQDKEGSQQEDTTTTHSDVEVYGHETQIPEEVAGQEHETDISHHEESSQSVTESENISDHSHEADQSVVSGQDNPDQSSDSQIHTEPTPLENESSSSASIAESSVSQQSENSETHSELNTVTESEEDTPSGIDTTSENLQVQTQHSSVAPENLGSDEMITEGPAVFPSDHQSEITIPGPEGITVEQDLDATSPPQEVHQTEQPTNESTENLTVDTDVASSTEGIGHANTYSANEGDGNESSQTSEILPTDDSNVGEQEPQQTHEQVTEKESSGFTTETVVTMEPNQESSSDEHQAAVQTQDISEISHEVSQPSATFGAQTDAPLQPVVTHGDLPEHEQDASTIDDKEPEKEDTDFSNSLIPDGESNEPAPQNTTPVPEDSGEVVTQVEDLKPQAPEADNQVIEPEESGGSQGIESNVVGENEEEKGHETSQDEIIESTPIIEDHKPEATDQVPESGDGQSSESEMSPTDQQEHPLKPESQPAEEQPTLDDTEETGSSNLNTNEISELPTDGSEASVDTHQSEVPTIPPAPQIETSPESPSSYSVEHHTTTLPESQSSETETSDHQTESQSSEPSDNHPASPESQSPEYTEPQTESAESHTSESSEHHTASPESPESQSPEYTVPQTESAESQTSESSEYHTASPESPESQSPEYTEPHTESPESLTSESSEHYTASSESQPSESSEQHTESSESSEHLTESPESQSSESQPSESSEQHTESSESSEHHTESPESQSSESQPTESSEHHTESSESSVHHTESPESQSPESRPSESSEHHTELPVSSSSESYDHHQQISESQTAEPEDIQTEAYPESQPSESSEHPSESSSESQPSESNEHQTVPQQFDFSEQQSETSSQAPSESSLHESEGQTSDTVEHQPEATIASPTDDDAHQKLSESSAAETEKSTESSLPAVSSDTLPEEPEPTELVETLTEITNVSQSEDTAAPQPEEPSETKPDESSAQQPEELHPDEGVAHNTEVPSVSQPEGVTTQPEEPSAPQPEESPAPQPEEPSAPQTEVIEVSQPDDQTEVSGTQTEQIEPENNPPSQPDEPSEVIPPKDVQSVESTSSPETHDSVELHPEGIPSSPSEEPAVTNADLTVGAESEETSEKQPDEPSQGSEPTPIDSGVSLSSSTDHIETQPDETNEPEIDVTQPEHLPTENVVHDITHLISNQVSEETSPELPDHEPSQDNVERIGTTPLPEQDNPELSSDKDSLVSEVQETLPTENGQSTSTGDADNLEIGSSQTEPSESHEPTISLPNEPTVQEPSQDDSSEKLTSQQSNNVDGTQETVTEHHEAPVEGDHEQTELNEISPESENGKPIEQATGGTESADNGFTVVEETSEKHEASSSNDETPVGDVTEENISESNLAPSGEKVTEPESSSIVTPEVSEIEPSSPVVNSNSEHAISEVAEHVTSGSVESQHVTNTEEKDVPESSSSAHPDQSSQGDLESSPQPESPSSSFSESSPAPSVEIPSTEGPVIPSSLPPWTPKPSLPTSDHSHPHTDLPHPDEPHFPSQPYDTDYDEDDTVSYGPGTCRYAGKVYLSAQQIPRDDPCDFCFCFRSDILCLQQSCPPPIRGCRQETIKGFCCPRYACHVSMATVVNITTTSTTTTTTVPPHFLSHHYNGSAVRAGCLVGGVSYKVGDKIATASGPCQDCRCGDDGLMRCDPTHCSPHESILSQVIAASNSRRRRR